MRLRAPEPEPTECSVQFSSGKDCRCAMCVDAIIRLWHAQPSPSPSHTSAPLEPDLREEGRKGNGMEWVLGVWLLGESIIDCFVDFRFLPIVFWKSIPSFSRMDKLPIYANLEFACSVWSCFIRHFKLARIPGFH